uniref:Uncharacterized protein n=1 Tax=Heterorhabditis bacteriophora TaxID=37862 RepID=A0A1I7WEJ2_HETBA
MRTKKTSSKDWKIHPVIVPPIFAHFPTGFKHNQIQKDTYRTINIVEQKQDIVVIVEESQVVHHFLNIRLSIIHKSLLFSIELYSFIFVSRPNKLERLSFQKNIRFLVVIRIMNM